MTNREKAEECWKKLKYTRLQTKHIDLEAIERALNEAEIRGMERAALFLDDLQADDKKEGALYYDGRSPSCCARDLRAEIVRLREGK